MRALLALIIEDDKKLADIFSEALQLINIKTEIAIDGRIAKKRLKELVPDIVILDLHLPYISGIEILDEIRADERLAETKVAVVTADLYRAEPLRSKADAVITKPISFKQLINIVNRLYPAQTPYAN